VTKRELLTVVSALGVHALLWVMMPHAIRSPDPAPPVVELAVELEPSPVPTADEAASEAVAVAGAVAVNRRGGTPGGVGATGAGGTEPGSATSLTTGPADSAAVGSFGGLYVVTPVQDSRETLGFNGPGSYRNGAMAAASASALHDQVQHALTDPLHARDLELGLMGDGPVVSALKDTTRAAPSPLAGHAIFAVTIDATGTVLRIGVESSSGDRSAWDEIARDSTAALSQRKLRVPAGTKGLALRIAVDSAMQLPSGGQHAITPEGLGGRFDVSDIGASPQRVVAAHTLSASSL